MVRNKAVLFWLAVLLCFVVFISAVQAVALPFAVGILLAYLLDPVADRLETWGISRTLATIAILIVVFFGFVLALVLLVPALAEQAVALGNKIPEYLHKANGFINAQLEKYNGSYGFFEGDPTIEDRLKEFSEVGVSLISGLAKSVWQSGMALFNLLSLLLITPVVSFYMIRDWDVLVERVDNMLPRKHKKTIEKIATDIDNVLSGFIHGQLTVSFLLGIFYAVGLSLVGLDSALLIGFGTGIMTIIPFVGMLVGGAIGLVVAFYQFATIEPVLYVAAVFAVGQMLEGNIVAPKLIGDKVGLHPVWMIFGMLVGGSLLGFLGVIVAIPVTAVAGVLIRFGIEQYKKSDLYEAPKPKRKTSKRRKARAK